MKKLIFSGIIAIGGVYYLTLDSDAVHENSQKQILQTAQVQKNTSDVKIVNHDKPIYKNLANHDKKLPSNTVLKKDSQTSENLQTVSKDKSFVEYTNLQDRVRTKQLAQEKHKAMMKKIQASKQKQQQLRKKHQQQIALRMMHQQRIQQQRMQKQNLRMKSIYEQNMLKNIEQNKQNQQS